MTPAEFNAIRRRLGFSVNDLGAMLDTDPRTIRRWTSEKDPRPVNPIAAKIVRLIDEGVITTGQLEK